jgi:uncharacterized protein involved in exopolysaccharide biosynthesis
MPDPDAVGAASIRVADQAMETSVVALSNSVYRHRRLTFGLAIAGLLCGGVFGMFQPRKYASHASFTTDDSRNSASSSLSQLGLAGLLAGGSQSSQVYLDLLVSPVILGPVLDSTYTITEEGKTRRTTLASLYAGHAKNAVQARANALDKLASQIKDELRPSGAVSVDVTTSDRSLSQQIASRIFGRLNAFNLERRQQRASNERQFTEERLAATQSELRAAENRLQSFMLDNRTFRNSPTLSLQADRLQREVTFRQTLYTSVAQAYEQARMEEVRNTPTANILEPPDFPLREAPRWGGLKAGSLGLVIGLIIGLAISVFRDFFGQAVNANPSDAAEFSRLRQKARGFI